MEHEKKKKMTGAISNVVLKNLPCHPPCSLFSSWSLDKEDSLQDSGASGNGKAIDARNLGSWNNKNYLLLE